MLSVIFWGVWLSAKIAFFCLLVPYLLYYRVICYYQSKWHYQAQNVKVDPNAWPSLGSIIPLFKCQLRAWRNGDNLHPMCHHYNDEVG